MASPEFQASNNFLFNHIRIAHGVTKPSEINKRTGIPYSTLSKLGSDREFVTIRTLHKFLLAFPPRDWQEFDAIAKAWVPQSQAKESQKRRNLSVSARINTIHPRLASLKDKYDIGTDADFARRVQVSGAYIARLNAGVTSASARWWEKAERRLTESR